MDMDTDTDMEMEMDMGMGKEIVILLYQSNTFPPDSISRNFDIANFSVLTTDFAKF